MRFMRGTNGALIGAHLPGRSNTPVLSLIAEVEQTSLGTGSILDSTSEAYMIALRILTERNQDSIN